MASQLLRVMGASVELMDVRPAVTIVIPCWNETPVFLRQAVDSAVSDLSEVIVVDDGSTSVETIACLQGLPVKVIRTENGGPARARNLGAAAGTARYILPLDSDDYLGEGMVQALVSALDADPDLAIAYTGWRRFGDDEGDVSPPERVSLTQLADFCVINNSAMFRRSAWEALGGYDESLRQGFEDWEWWLRLLLAGGRAGLTPGVIYHYRVRSQSRNQSNHGSVDALVATRSAMLRNNPEAAALIAEGMISSIKQAYQQGQAQSPLAERAIAELRQWARRFGRVDGALNRLPALGWLWGRTIERR